MNTNAVAVRREEEFGPEFESKHLTLSYMQARDGEASPPQSHTNMLRQSATRLGPFPAIDQTRSFFYDTKAHLCNFGLAGPA